MDLDKVEKMMMKFFWFTAVPRLLGRLGMSVLLIGFSRDLNNETNRNVAFYLGMTMLLWVFFSAYRTTKVYFELKSNSTSK
jgi:hypothetical protein